MRSFEIVAGIIAVFFLTGIAVGMLIVAAIAPLRRRGGRERYLRPANQGNPPSLDDDDEERRPRWPQG